ncbi:ribonuclease domain-containing protein [Lentzea flaviverrucosa]|uniref:Ribonuclease n=1 Tax=Lentzea flaviverrucosa TaxID=200379 RepID=A0A1H9XJD1_9PSEU|nr:ribonuclease domain-containing protein [Lentzea flaviverrucosa]RDI20182.1 ribonuclease [Lentzea flaviverrucosa]SES45753.1 ribonuclease [Lentzea flaviverrucosa]
MSPGRRLTVALVGLLALVVIGWFVKDNSAGTPPENTTKPVVTSAAQAETVPGSNSGLDVEALSKLPAEAGKTWKLIEANGPFPHPRNDGVTFQNREKRLPAKSSGYYKEYTVPTPGSPDRGARRLVTGSEKEVFYTGDHYSSFVVVDVKK